MKAVRTSRYRHMYAEASAAKIENLRLQTKGSENQNLAVSGNLMVAIPWTSGGGGTVAVLDGKEFPSGGRVSENVSGGNVSTGVQFLTGHTGPVTDLVWSPFENLLYTASEDATVRIYGRSLSGENFETVGILAGAHARRVTSVACNETAAGVVASAAFDGSVVLWNTEMPKNSARVLSSQQENGYVTTLAFGPSGNTLLATLASKGATIFDPRTPTKATGEISVCHDGPRGVRATWLGAEEHYLLTAGTTTGAKREVKLWDLRKSTTASAAVQTVGLDDNAGTMFPVFENSSNLLFLVGRGDGMVRIYEFAEGAMHPLTEYRTSVPQKAFVPFPKRVVDVTKNEVARFLKLETQAAQFVSFSVPRKSEMLQTDLYPPCFSGEPALKAADWFGGRLGTGPVLKSLAAPNTHKINSLAPVLAPGAEQPAGCIDLKMRVEELEAENIRLKAALEAELTITAKLRKMLGEN